MKKLTLVLILALILAACGADETDTSAAPEVPEALDATETEAPATEPETEDETEAEVESTDIIGHTFKTENYELTVNGTEVIESKYDDFGDILALDVTFTNNSDQSTSPWMAMIFKAEQETDTTVELLNGANGIFPEDYETEKVEMGDTNIKPDATVDAIIGFELLYPGEPVYIRDFFFDDYEFVIETDQVE